MFARHVADFFLSLLLLWHVFLDWHGNWKKLTFVYWTEGIIEQNDEQVEQSRVPSSQKSGWKNRSRSIGFDPRMKVGEREKRSRWLWLIKCPVVARDSYQLLPNLRIDGFVIDNHPLAVSVQKLNFWFLLSPYILLFFTWRLFITSQLLRWILDPPLN